MDKNQILQKKLSIRHRAQGIISRQFLIIMSRRKEGILLEQAAKYYPITIQKIITNCYIDPYKLQNPGIGRYHL